VEMVEEVSVEAEKLPGLVGGELERITWSGLTSTGSRPRSWGVARPGQGKAV
jgi:hypothetical protein